MIRYVFREPPAGIPNIDGADPQTIGEALDKIADDNDGELKPQVIVDTAQPADHPLNPHFEWDDGIAANAHRLDQARRLVRVIRVVDDSEEDPEPRRAYLSIRSPKEGRRYVPHREIINSSRLQLLVLEEAMRDLESWERRYAEIVDICREVRVLRERLRDRRRGLGGDDDRPSATH